MQTPVSLLQRIRQPDHREAWDEFVEIYAPILYTWARRANLSEKLSGKPLPLPRITGGEGWGEGELPATEDKTRPLTPTPLPGLPGRGAFRTASDSDASDLVQEVFVVLLRELPRFEYDPQRRFRGWLKTITLNKRNELLRRRRPEVGMALVACLVGVLMLAAQIIRIKDRDGNTVAEVPLPKDGSIEAVKDGKAVPIPIPEIKKNDPKPPVPVVPLVFPPEPLPAVEGREPFSPMALVSRPALLEGVRHWTIQTAVPATNRMKFTLGPDGKWLAGWIEREPMIHIWNARTLELERILVSDSPVGPDQALHWLPDSTRLAVPQIVQPPVIWDALAGKVVRRFNIEGQQTGRLSGDGSLLECTILRADGPGSGEQILIDVQTGKHREAVRWSKTGEPILHRRLLWQSTRPGYFYSVVDFDYATSRVRERRIPEELGQVETFSNGAALSPDGNLVYLQLRVQQGAGSRRRLVILDAETMQVEYSELAEGTNYSAIPAAFSPDSQAWVVDTAKKTDRVRLVVWDLKTGKTRSATLMNGRWGTGSPTWVPDGKHLFVPCNDDLYQRNPFESAQVWQAEPLRPIREIPGILCPLNRHDAMFSPDGKIFRTRNGTYHDTLTGEPILTWVTYQTSDRDIAELQVSAEGHYRCTDPTLEADLRYVAELADGTQRTYTAAEFAAKFGWKNDPAKVRLRPIP